jgi:hypothetical protein
MGKAELFSYLSAFVTIVLALALTNMLQSASVLIQARRRVRWDARPIVFAAIVFVALVSEFFSLWLNLSVTKVTMPRLLWLMTIPSLFAILAYSALPNNVGSEGRDLAEFFEQERRLWPILFSIITILDWLRSADIAYSSGASITQIIKFTITTVLPLMFLPAGIALSLLFFSKSRKLHWVALTILSVWVLGSTLSSSIAVAASSGG